MVSTPTEKREPVPQRLKAPTAPPPQPIPVATSPPTPSPDLAVEAADEDKPKGFFASLFKRKK
jgi:hypothetical protein